MASAQHVSQSFSHLMTLEAATLISSFRLYKSLSLMQVNGAAYKIICYVGHDGPYDFADNRPHVLLRLKAVYRSGRVDIFYVGNKKGTVYLMKYMPCFKTCDQCLLIAQRAARRWLSKQSSRRALPVAMALHKRLGKNAAIQCLQEDILRLVCGLL